MEHELHMLLKACGNESLVDFKATIPRYGLKHVCHFFLMQSVL
jgi:hypothetical protein